MIHRDVIERLTAAAHSKPGFPVIVKHDDLKIVLRELNRLHIMMENIRKELREGDPLRGNYVNDRK